jgi:hypothetical protein
VRTSRISGWTEVEAGRGSSDGSGPVGRSGFRPRHDQRDRAGCTKSKQKVGRTRRTGEAVSPAGRNSGDGKASSMANKGVSPPHSASSFSPPFLRVCFRCLHVGLQNFLWTATRCSFKCLMETERCFTQEH